MSAVIYCHLFSYVQIKIDIFSMQNNASLSVLTIPPDPTRDKLKDETKTRAVTTMFHRFSSKNVLTGSVCSRKGKTNPENRSHLFSK